MTEKNYNPNQKENKAMKKQKAVQPKPEVKAPVKEDKIENNKEEKTEVKELKKEIKKIEVQKIHKDSAVVRGMSLPISTKTAADVCRFVKGKNIQKAIAELDLIARKKVALPMRGELAHQKGKGIMSGGYPKKASEIIANLLKNLQANANANGMIEPVVSEAVANIASRPFGKFGRIRKKRTHVVIKALEKSRGKK